MLREADVGAPREDDAEDRAGAFLCLAAGFGAELVGAFAKTPLQSFRQFVLFECGDPVHGNVGMAEQDPRLLLTKRHSHPDCGLTNSG